jgi:hypothetical protein
VVSFSVAKTEAVLGPYLVHCSTPVQLFISSSISSRAHPVHPENTGPKCPNVITV